MRPPRCRWLCAALLLGAVLLSGCGGGQVKVVLSTPPPEPTATTIPAPTAPPRPSSTPEPFEWSGEPYTPPPTAEEQKAAARAEAAQRQAEEAARQKLFRSAVEDSKAALAFSHTSGFYDHDIVLELSAEDAVAIYYTMDGAEPGYSKYEYTRPIVLSATHLDLPKCVVIRAIAYFSDGTKSPVFTQSYFLDTEIASRFSTLIFSVIGDPFALTHGPEAIFNSVNARERGREMEREICLQVFTPEGEMVLSQDAGMRVFGGESRKHPIKSLKFYARKDYDPQHKTFDYDFFQTPRLRGGTIKSYKRFVARNGGNDNQWAFIRDEYSQTMARSEGLLTMEAVRPVLIYLNGEYYALHWLHETYCDEFFQSKFGKADGEYIVIEGREKIKSHTDPTKDDYQPEADEFQRRYEYFTTLDLRDEASFAEVCAYIDVENYLDYFAHNIYISNWDWPQNNEKAFAYFPEDGVYEEGTVRDGRWRFLIHDTDYSFGIYGKDITIASNDTIMSVLSEESEHHSPLFALLMQRPDCRRYFVERMTWLADEVFAPDNALAILDELDASRSEELSYYYIRLNRLKKENTEVWTRYDIYERSLELVRDFLRERPDYIHRYLAEDLPLLD